MKYKLENMILNVNQMTLKKGDSGELISSDEKLIAAMKLLVERYPNIVTKEEMIKELWPRQIVTDWSLTRFISDMRKVLGDTHNIKTVHGRGYRYTYPVEEFKESDCEAASASASATAPASENAEREVKAVQPTISKSKFQFNQRIFKAFVFGGVLVSAIAIGVFVTQKSDLVTNSEPAVIALMGASDKQPVVAVLPIVDSGSRFETGLSLASLLNGMLKLHDGIHVANEAATHQRGVTIDLAKGDLKQQLHSLCAKAGCTDMILLHYLNRKVNSNLNNTDKVELSFSHYHNGEIFLSSTVVEENPIQALKSIYKLLESRLPKSLSSLTPLLLTNNENALLAYGEATGALASGDLSRAKYNLQAAIRLQPDFYHATALLANLMLYRDKKEEARI